MVSSLSAANQAPILLLFILDFLLPLMPAPEICPSAATSQSKPSPGFLFCESKSVLFQSLSALLTFRKSNICKAELARENFK